MSKGSFIVRAALSLAVAVAGFACDKGKSGQTLTVGFSQVGAESAWRTANTDSVKKEAEKRGIKLQFSDAQQKQDNQIKAIQNFITQGVDVIALAPVVNTGWDPVLKEAKAAGIPVVLQDRMIETSDPSLYAAFVGTDATNEGRLAGEFLVKATNGKATVVELEGTPGSDPAIQRHNGFTEAIKGSPGIKVVKSQTGEFTRAKGREVMEAFLNSPEGKSITAVFAHNDDMGLGAVQAIEAAGKQPGKDILIVSVDGVKDAIQALADGKINCSVECSPLLGPKLYDTIQAVAEKKQTEKRVINPAVVYTQENAKAALPTRQY